MSIFQTTAPTKEQIFLKGSKASLIQLKSLVTMSFKNTWENPNITAQECFDALGVEAAKTLDAHYNCQLAIKLLDSSWQFLSPPHPYTVNVDGSVTVNYPEPEPEPEAPVEEGV